MRFLFAVRSSSALLQIQHVSAQQQVRLAQLLTSLPIRHHSPVQKMMADNPNLWSYAHRLDYGIGPKSLGEVNGFGPAKLLSHIPEKTREAEPLWARAHLLARQQMAKQVKFNRDLLRGDERRSFNFPDPNPPGFGWK